MTAEQEFSRNEEVLVTRSRIVIVGLVLIGLAVWWGRQAKPVYNIFFGTAGGEKQALTSPDAEYVNRVAQAINEALIARA